MALSFYHEFSKMKGIFSRSFGSKLKWKFYPFPYLYTSLVFFWFYPNSQAQIVITSDEIPSTPGIVNEYYSNLGDSDTVDVGGPGGPQTWDFSRGSRADSVAERIVVADETPFGEQFQDANVVYETDGLNIAGLDTASGFMYMKLTEEGMDLLGSATGNIFGVPLAIVFDSSLTSIPLPLEYGSSWADSTLFLNVFEDLIENPSPNPLLPDPYLDVKVEIGFALQGKIDGWGRIIVPHGQYDVLRVKRLETTRLNLSVFVGFNFMSVFDSTQTVITYDWYAENLGSVVTVTSRPGETDPNFTEAHRVRRLIRTNAGVGDVTGDSIIDILDILAIIDHILEIQPLEGDALRRADCNYDGFIDILDLFGIVCIILGVDDCKP